MPMRVLVPLLILASELSAQAVVPVVIETSLGNIEAAIDAAHRRVHEAREYPLAGGPKVLGYGKAAVVLHRGGLPERTLRPDGGDEG